ncbi:hypothetical protein CFB82_22055, partial [Burkholderia sp. HI2714]
VTHGFDHRLPQVRLRRLIQLSGISFRLHTRITHHELFGALVSNYRQWVGPGFDPELFDLRAANAALMRLATNRWGNR